MVQIRDPLLDAVRPVIDLLPLLASPPLKAMQAEQVAILSLDYMFLRLVSPQSAEFDEIGRIANRGRYC